MIAIDGQSEATAAQRWLLAEALRVRGFNVEVAPSEIDLRRAVIRVSDITRGIVITAARHLALVSFESAVPPIGFLLDLDLDRAADYQAEFQLLYSPFRLDDSATSWELHSEILERVLSLLPARIAERHPPPIPTAEPSPSRFLARNGTIELAPNPAPTALSTDVESAWSVVREALLELQTGGIGNSPRLARSIQRAINGLGASPAELDVIRSGMAGLNLQALAEDANNLLLEDAASLLRAASVQHAVLMAQFDDWQAFVAKLEAPMANQETEADAARDVATIRANLEEQDAISPAANERLLEEEAAALPISDDGTPPSPPAPAERRGFLRSGLAAIHALAVDVLAKAREGSLSGVAASAKAAIITTAATGSAAVLLELSGHLSALATKLPAEWGWVAQLLQWVRGLVG